MPRTFRPRSLAAGLAVVAASTTWSGMGCSPTKPTELVPAALSQIEVPKNLAGIKIEVFANGAPKFINSYKVVEGTAFLPATLGIVSSGSAETTVTVVIAGYNNAAVNDPAGEFQDPTKAIGDVGAASGPSVKRGSVQTYVDQHTLFLPMSLSYSCWGTDCSNGGTSSDTCKANTCTSSSTNARALAEFDPALVDGTQDCFAPSSCFSPATTALSIDDDRCLYEVPPGQAGGSGLNVRIFYQDMTLARNAATGRYVPQAVPTSEQEILSEEPQGSLLEGFSIPNAAKPRQFQLASGLCSLVKLASHPPVSPADAGTGKYHTISAVQVSTTCPPKQPLLPVCAGDQNVSTRTADGGTTTNIVCDQPVPLDPAPSAIYLVMDDSSIMSGAFGPDGYATAMGLSLSNPVFKRTYVGFEFLDHKAADCTATSTPYTAPGMGPANSLDFTLANVAQPTIASFLLHPTPPDPAPDGGVPPGGFAPLYLQAAMRSDVGVYKHLSDFASSLSDPLQIAAAMFFVNRQPDSTGSGDAGAQIPTGVDCDPALDTAADQNAQTAVEQQVVAAQALGLQSYFVVLNNGQPQLGTPLAYFKNIQTAVKASGVTTMQVLDATQAKTNAAAVLASFSNVATALGTCLYELPPGVDTNAHLAFTLPIPTAFSGIAPASVPLKFNGACSAATQDSVDGWNIDGAHLRVCGTASPASCWKIRQAVLAVAATALQSAADAGTGDAGAPTIPEVPLTVTMPCADGGH